jgi:hypothetical protein
VSKIHQEETLYCSLLILPAVELRILFAGLKCVDGLAMIDNTRVPVLDHMETPQ